MFGFEASFYDNFEAAFEVQCKGKTDCFFTFKRSDLPQSQCNYYAA